MFGDMHLVTNKPGTLTWKMEDLALLSACFGQMLSETGKLSCGLMGTLNTESQHVTRVLATIIPTYEMSVVEMPRGVDRNQNVPQLHMYVCWRTRTVLETAKTDLCCSLTDVSVKRIEVRS